MYYSYSNSLQKNYTFSVKSCYSYLNIFSILLPIVSLYRLNIATLYRHLYIKYIEITYNITYKGSLYFVIPDVISAPLVHTIYTPATMGSTTRQT